MVQEEKKLKKRSYTIIVLLCIVAVFISGYLLLTHINQNTSDNQTRIQVSQMNPNSIVNISYKYKDREYEFIKSSNTWIYAEDEDFPLDNSFIEYMTVRLGDIVSTMRIGEVNDTNFTDLGFNKPTLVIRASTDDGMVYEYTIGSYSEIISRYYMLINDEKEIHIVEQGLVNAFSYDLYDMIEMDIPPEFYSSAVTRFSIEKDKKIIKFNYFEDGIKNSYSNHFQWSITDDTDREYIAGTEKIVNLLSYTGYGLKIDRCVLYNAKESDYSEFGLDNPVVISIDYIDDFMRINTIKYYIGKQISNQYYFMFENSSMIFLIDVAIAEPLMLTDPLQFRSDMLMMIKLESIDRMIIKTSSDSFVVNMIRNSESKDVDDKNTIYTINGKEISYREMNDIYSLIYFTAADKVLPDQYATDDVPKVSIEFERNTEEYMNMTMDFVPYDSSYYVVLFNDRKDQLFAIHRVDELLSRIELLINRV